MLGKMDCFGLTDVGRVRETNEDQFLIANLSRSLQIQRTSLDLDNQTRLFGTSQGRLLLVADGMGGVAGGRRASSLAVDSLTTYVLNTMHWFFRLRQDSEDHFADDLRGALEYCHAQVRAEAERVPGWHGMGTTLTMAYLVWPRMYVVHVGDSRCYLLRKGKLKQLTRDHTLAQKMAEEGALTDPETSSWSNVLWNVVGGTSDEMRPEVYQADLALGDSVLLCSDGLSKHVSNEEVARLLSEDHRAADTCRALVHAANAAGGSDNVTVVVAHFRDSQHQAEVEAAAAEARPARMEAAVKPHRQPIAEVVPQARAPSSFASPRPVIYTPFGDP